MLRSSRRREGSRFMFWRREVRKVKVRLWCRSERKRDGVEDFNKFWRVLGDRFKW